MKINYKLIGEKFKKETKRKKINKIKHKIHQTLISKDFVWLFNNLLLKIRKVHRY